MNIARCSLLCLIALTAFACARHASEPAAKIPRLSEPRIPPVDATALSPEQRRLLAPFSDQGRVYNVITTLAQHPRLANAFRDFGNYILFESTLPPRHRELVILRTAWLTQSEYEFAQHARLAQFVGLTPEEIARVADGHDARGWTDFERTLLRATDQLHADSMIADNVWNALDAEYSQEQLMDLVFTVGQYHLVAMALNTFGVQLDEGLTGFPGSEAAAEPDPETGDETDPVSASD